MNLFRSRKSVVISILILALIAFFGISLKKGWVRIPTQKQTPAVLDVAWLKQATYNVDGQPIKLNDGKAEIIETSTSTEMDGSEYITTSTKAYISLDQSAFGNVSNSGKLEAVVVLTNQDTYRGSKVQKVYLVVWDNDHYSVIPSSAPQLVHGETVNKITFKDNQINFSITRYAPWDNYDHPTRATEEQYSYQNKSLAKFANLFESTSTPPLLETAINSSFGGDELVSPDGEWYFAGERYFGKEPFSRALSWYLEFINMKGKGNRYVYEDWFERPEDGNYASTFRTAHPIGWSADGGSVYMAYVEPLKDKNLSLPKQLNGYWDIPVNVVKINLQNPTFGYSNFQGVKPTNSDNFAMVPQVGVGDKGYILDLLPKEDRALWFEPAIRKADIQPKKGVETPQPTPAKLVFFRPSDNGNARIVAQWNENDPSTVTSASLDRDSDTERVAYVVHKQGQNDEAFVYTSTTSTTSTVLLDLKPYRNTILKNGISEPYKLIVEKTAMDLPGGLFLVVIGSNNEIMFIRFNDFGKGYSPSLSKNGLL